MNTLKKYIVCSLGLFVVISCSPRSSNRKQVLVDSDVKKVSKVTASKEVNLRGPYLDEMMAKVEPLVVEALSKPSDQVDDKLIYTEVIQYLRKDLLNIDFLIDPKVQNYQSQSGQFVLRRLVNLFNEALLLVYKVNPELIINVDILKDYKQVILWDCSERTSGTCKMVEFYRFVDSPSVSKILGLIHNHESIDTEKNKILKVAFEIKNNRLDQGLRLLLLERLADNLTGERLGRISKKEARRDADLFANLLKIDLQGRKSFDAYREIIGKINPWQMSRRIDSPRTQAMSDLIGFAAQNFMYSSQGDALSDELTEAIDGMKYVIGNLNEQGVLFQLANLRGEWLEPFQNHGQMGVLESNDSRQVDQIYKQYRSQNYVEVYTDKGANIVKNLIGDVDFVFDEYFFLSHQLFYDHYSLSDGDSFWKSTRKDKSKLVRAFLNTLKLKIVDSIVMTNSRMNRFYEETSSTRIIQLLRESNKESSSIAKEWDQIIRRSGHLRNFANRVLDRTKPNEAKQLKEVDDLVISLAKDIKFLVTYPSMFPLLYMMSENNLVDSFKNFWGSKVEIDSSSVVNTFFSGGFKPWFNFKNDDIALDRTELVYTFYYALQTEIFSTYSDNKKFNFSVEDFFRIIVKDLVTSEEGAIRAAADLLQSQIEKNQNALANIERYCKEEIDGQAFKKKALAELQDDLQDDFSWEKHFNQTIKGPRSLQSLVPFESLNSGKIYSGTSEGVEEIGTVYEDIYSSKTLTALTKLRTVDKSVLSQVKLMRDIYRIYGGDKVEKIESIFDEKMFEYQRLSKKYIQDVYKIDQKIGDCGLAFYEREKDITHGIIFAEANALGKLFDRISAAVDFGKSLNNGKFSVQQIQKIEKARKDYMVGARDNVKVLDPESGESKEKFYFPQEYATQSGLLVIDESGLSMYKVDAVVRLKEYLKQLFPGQFFVDPPVDFTKSGGIFTDDSVVKLGFSWTGNPVVDRKNFIQKGLKIFKKYLPWLEKFPDPRHLENRQNLLVTLFKMNEFSIDEGVDCQDSEIAPSIRDEACVTLSPEKLIQSHRDFLNHINISDRDEVVLNYFSLKKKYTNLDFFNDYIKYKKEDRLYSYYDLLFKSVYSDALPNKQEEVWYLKDLSTTKKSVLVDYIDSVQKREDVRFTFPFPAEIEDAFRKYYSGWIDDHLFAVNRLLEAILKEVSANEAGTGVEPFRFAYSLNFTNMKIGVSDSFKLSPFLSKNMVDKFLKYIVQINFDSSRYFEKLVYPYQKRAFQIAGQDLVEVVKEVEKENAEEIAAKAKADAAADGNSDESDEESSSDSTDHGD